MTTKPSKLLPLDAVMAVANASPFYRHLDMRVTEWTATGCVTRMTVDDRHLNLMGIAHGGAIASLADSTCGLSLATALSEDETAVTQSLNVNYLAPAAKGTLTGKGWIVTRGRHSAVLEADIFDAGGKKVAHAHTVHVINRRAPG